MDDRWLTTADLAARYHTEPSTIRYWRHTGYGPEGTRFGRRVLYKEADVLAWEKQKEADDRPARSRSRRSGKRSAA